MILIIGVMALVNVSAAGQLDVDMYMDYSKVKVYNEDKNLVYLKQVLPALLKSNGIKADE